MRGSTQSERGNGGIGIVVFNQENHPERQGEAIAPPSLPIVVPCTTFELSQAAMKVVADFAKHLRTATTMVAVQIVPYTLPLDNPPVCSAFYRRRLQEIVSDSPVPVTIELLLARDREIALKQFLTQPSLVLVVSKGERWRRKTPEERLACALRRAGHTVALVTIK
jgi:hypothetical protein